MAIQTRGFGLMHNRNKLNEATRTFIELGGDKAVIDQDGTVTIQSKTPHGPETVILTKTQVDIIKNSLQTPVKKLNIGGGDIVNIGADKSVTVVSKAPHGVETVILDKKQVEKLFGSIR
jgi:hypothetical protein